MKKARLFITMVLIVTLFLSPAWSEKQVPADEEKSLILKAESFIVQLENGKYSDAVSSFDKVMTEKLPESKLKELWEKITSQLGTITKKGQPSVVSKGEVRGVIIPCAFEKGSFDLQVYYNTEGKLTGFFIRPSTSDSDKSWTPPAYAKPDSFKEKEVQFGKEGAILPGVISIPVGKGVFPAVVLVHGSGPNDKDETIGPNKVFKDMAWGLASKGIVVFRYDKRTKVHPENFMKGNFTVYEEAVEDALLAVNYLRNQKEVKVGPIFVLGHSLGGMLIPRIARKTPDAAGYIVMAGAARPLEEIVLEQYNYIFSADGVISDDEKEVVDKLEKAVALLKSSDFSKDTPAEKLPLNLPASYWLDLKDYKPADEAKAIKKPVLILQGKRDYQVNMKCFGLWRKALKDHKNVTFRIYGLLNHLFIEGEGKSLPSEYKRPGFHVSADVIDDTAEWILKNKE